MSLWPPWREDQAKLERSLGAHVQEGRSGRQTKTGASGSELLVAGKQVPDRASVGRGGAPSHVPTGLFASVPGRRAA
jgi:hypothetical protein